MMKSDKVPLRKSSYVFTGSRFKVQSSELEDLFCLVHLNNALLAADLWKYEIRWWTWKLRTVLNCHVL